MRVIKTFFDKEAYAKEIRQIIDASRDTDYLDLYSPRSLKYSNPYEYDKAICEEAAKKVDRSKYETKVVYLYLNAVVCNGCPKFIVYSEEKGVEMIDVNDCKIEEDEQGSDI